jgi:hypothetical protein
MDSVRWGSSRPYNQVRGTEADDDDDDNNDVRIVVGCCCDGTSDGIVILAFVDKDVGSRHKVWRVSSVALPTSFVLVVIAVVFVVEVESEMRIVR